MMVPPRKHHAVHALLALFALLVLAPPFSVAKLSVKGARDGSEREGSVLANYVVEEQGLREQGLKGEAGGHVATVEARSLREKIDNSPGKRGIKRWCGTKHPGSEAAAKMDLQVTRLISKRGARSAPKVRRVPVYFHNIYYHEPLTGVTVGKLALAQIRRQMQVLNAGFGGTLKPQGGPFRDDGTPKGSIQVRFYLAGVVRYQTGVWSNFQFDPDSPVSGLFRIATRRGGCATLNVYTHRSETPDVLGMATFPWDCTARTGQRIDGVFVDPGTLPGAGKTLFNLGRTLVHETGHWVGLLHTFEGVCDTYNDGVRDTPAEADATFGCPSVVNSCPQLGADPIRNLMDYGDDRCIWKFTPGQGARAAYYFTVFRTREVL